MGLYLKFKLGVWTNIKLCICAIYYQKFENFVTQMQIFRVANRSWSHCCVEKAHGSWLMADKSHGSWFMVHGWWSSTSFSQRLMQVGSGEIGQEWTEDVYEIIGAAVSAPGIRLPLVASTLGGTICCLEWWYYYCCSMGVCDIQGMVVWCSEIIVYENSSRQGVVCECWAWNTN